MKIKNFSISFWLISLCFCFFSGCAEETQNIKIYSQDTSLTREEPASDSVTAIPSEDSTDPTVTNTRDIVVFLSGMQDRLTGSDNNTAACNYIAEQYKQIGLQPFIQDNYYWEYEQQIDGKDTTVNNVVGYIKGTDSKQAIVVSCHLDSVKDAPGAVDNASGVAAMLQTAGSLYHYKDSLKDDIIFCAFNGEEQNYAGSAAFVTEFQGLYNTACNINYDCVGVINGGAYMFGADVNDISYQLNTALRPFLDENAISYNEYPVSSIRSDHISFNNAEIPNVDFTQIGILSITHSPNDTIVHLDMEQIEILANAVTEFIISSQEEY